MNSRLRILILIMVSSTAALPAYAQALQTIGQARRSSNGSPVKVSGTVIYGSPGYKTGFVIEASDRSAGILVTGNRVPASGELVTVSGTASSLRGERAIINATVTTTSSGNALPKPLITRLSWFAKPGATTSPRNLLVRIYGKVTEIGTNYLYINDGSLRGRGMKVVGTVAGAGMGDILTGLGTAIIDTVDTTENSGAIILGWSMSISKIPYAGRSQTDITARWNQLKPAATGSPYAVTPSWVPPFAAGSLTPQFQQDAINMVNFMRYIAGVPDDVAGEPAWYNEQQHGAVILKALGTLTHTPTQPAGMANDFYSLAYSACNTSNLSYGWWSSGSYVYQATAAESVNGYMNDSGPNESHVGHRRWVLNPAMKRTAFGWCESFSDMKSFDSSRTPKANYLYVAWPSPGAFPLELCPKELPWSITLNTSYYSYTGQEKVTLVRLRDGLRWQFSAASVPAGGLFTVNTQGYGVPYCIIFRPEKALSYAAGDTFRVTLTGLKKKDGSSDSLSWDTTLFRLPGFQHYYYRR